MTPNKKKHVLSLDLAALDQHDESSRVEALTSGVEKHLSRARMFVEQIEAHRLDLSHLTICVTATSLEELVCNCICMLVTRLSNIVNV